MRASPMADCAAFAERSVSSNDCFTMSKSSPQATIISDVMNVFSTMSSAALVFSNASGRSSSKATVSRSSTAFCFWSCSTFSREFFMLLSSLLTASCKFRMVLLMCWKCLTASPAANRCESCTFLTNSERTGTCGASSCSASRYPLAMPLLPAPWACSSMWFASDSALVTSSCNIRSFSSPSALSIASLFLTESAGRTCPSQGIFQPAPGGRSPLSLQCDQTWVPPSLLPNHQPSKLAPSRLSQ
mmetsp:Transcript_85786/g.265594  ORF Transcript_85786/g.265594 Transcript_85786/m.265594 type:complete len:244 (+) Transcript_85786:2224-2955(+)